MSFSLFHTYHPDPDARESYRIRRGAHAGPGGSAGNLMPFWVPADMEVRVHQYTLCDGLFYLCGAGDAARVRGIEPSLVDEDLPLGHDDDYRKSSMEYYPTYAAARPDDRAAYLHWLARGRRDPRANMGYVYLYFYGLERRVAIDAQQHADAKTSLPAIREELEELALVYQNASFVKRAKRLIAYCNLVEGKRLYLEPPPEFAKPVKVAEMHRMALTQAAEDGYAPPANWMLSWLLTESGLGGQDLVRGAYAEFAAAFAAQASGSFAARFAALKPSRHGEGWQYRGVSTALPQTQPDQRRPDAIEARLAALVSEIGRTVERELRPYVRHIAQHPRPNPLAPSRLLLPFALWPAPVRERMEALSVTLPTHQDLSEPVNLASLVAPLDAGAVLELLSARSLSEHFARSLQMGFEPDVRTGSAALKVDTPLVFFRLVGDGACALPEPNVEQVTRIGFMADILRACRAGDDDAFFAADTTILDWPDLEPGHYLRTKALLVAQSQPTLAPAKATGSLKRRLERLGNTDRIALAKSLVEIALAGGVMPPREAAALLDHYCDALGMLRQDLFRLLTDRTHARACAASAPVSGDTREHEAAPAARLDMRRVAQLRKETVEVGRVLGAIFSEAVAESAAVKVEAPSTPGSADAAGTPPCALPLEGKHAVLCTRLLTKNQWARSAVAALCAELGLMVDGALERINEAAFDVFDEPLIEGDDPLDVNLELLAGAA